MGLIRTAVKENLRILRKYGEKVTGGVI